MADAVIRIDKVLYCEDPVMEAPKEGMALEYGGRELAVQHFVSFELNRPLIKKYLPR